MDIHSLTLEEKVGQLFIVGFNDTKMTGELMHLLTHFKVGGLFYTTENVQHIKQLHTLSTNVQFYAKTGLPAFLGVEQAGGDVNAISEGLTISPSQATIGHANNRLYTKQIAEVVAKELRGIGVNMNLAPNLNVNVVDHHHFNLNGDLTAKHGTAAIQGYQKEQVFSVIEGLPNKPINNLATMKLDDKKTELYPFFQAIKQGVAGIVVPNLLVQPAPNNEYTKQLLTDTIRNRAAYDGLLMTEIELNEASVIDSVLLAIEAGVDIIYIPANYHIQIGVISTVLEAVKSGEISEARIDKSVARILALKAKYNIGEIPPFDRDLFKRKRSLDLVERLTERASVTH